MAGNAVIRLRRATAAELTSANPVLALGEAVIETDKRRVKVGDGSTAWTALPYFAGDDTGWAAYVHTGSSQTLTANTKVALVNNAGTVLEGQKPSDIAALYNGTAITGRNGDAIGIGVEFTFTPSDGTASNLYMAVDIGGAVGEIYPRDFPIFRGASVPHKISYNIQAYTLDTWAMNGGTVRVECDGPGSVTAVRYVIHRLHKAR